VRGSATSVSEFRWVWYISECYGRIFLFGVCDFTSGQHVASPAFCSFSAATWTPKGYNLVFIARGFCLTFPYICSHSEDSSAMHGMFVLTRVLYDCRAFCWTCYCHSVASFELTTHSHFAGISPILVLLYWWACLSSLGWKKSNLCFLRHLVGLFDGAYKWISYLI